MGVALRVGLLELVLGAAGALAAAAGEAEEWSYRPDGKLDQARIVRDLDRVLPAGWSVAGTAEPSAPDDWQTYDRVGFMVEGRKGEASFRAWFLPQDWIGIRRLDPKRQPLGAAEGILRGRECKVIVNSDDQAVHRAFLALRHFASPTLARGRWSDAKRIFIFRLEEADQKAQRLIAEFCPDADSREEAARSLAALGVPAKGVFLHFAREGRGPAREACLGALAYYLGDKAEVWSLCQALLDPESSRDEQQSAAYALGNLADPETGPALAAALDRVDPSGPLGYVLDAISRIRYQPAAARIHALMKQGNSWTAAHCANVLAGLQYREAIPDVKRLAKTAKFTAEWALDPKRSWSDRTGDVDTALLRLTGDWGQPAGGSRFLLLGPEQAEVGKPIKVALLVESVGVKVCWDFGLRAGVFSIDGREGEVGGYPVDGCWGPAVVVPRKPELGIRVGDGSGVFHPQYLDGLRTQSYDLSRMITTPGEHKVQYVFGTLQSNVLVLQVAPAEGAAEESRLTRVDSSGGTGLLIALGAVLLAAGLILFAVRLLRSGCLPRAT